MLGFARPTVSELHQAVYEDLRDTSPDLIATSVFLVEHGTRLPDAPVVYRNRYVLVRIGRGFGACSVPPDVDVRFAPDFSGRPVRELLDAPIPALRIATLDAYLSHSHPMGGDPRAHAVTLPAGTPYDRAMARDQAVISLANLQPGTSVGLIGVVTPLVRAITDAGCTPVLADRTMDSCLGYPVHYEGEEILDSVDTVIATGMTLVDGSFDRIRARCIKRGVGLLVYAQTGSAIIREFLGHGVTALNAEPFPFSQCSATETVLYQYRHHTLDSPNA